MSPREALPSSVRVVLLTYGFVVLEWLFFATKPSFLTISPFGEQVLALAIGALPFVGAALVAHALLLVGARILDGRGRELPRLAPALVIAATALTLIDNFSYTVFRFSLAHANWSRMFYLVALLWLVREVVSKPTPRGRGRLEAWAAAVLLFGSTAAFLGMGGIGSRRADETMVRMDGEAVSLPNIVFFAPDGVPSSRISALGYHRETTPHLAARMDDALVFVNAFSNSGWTTGSLTSMMTGKHPATTKVLFPPYILQGEDASQTLPRLLRDLGYRTIQETIRYYADGPDLNWRGSFHYANGRQVAGGIRAIEMDLEIVRTFVGVIGGRLGDRILHLVGVKEMKNPFEEVIGSPRGQVAGVLDEDRMRRVFEFIETGEGPFFAHIHLLGTHWPFRPRERYFSSGTFASEQEFIDASFDDTIREADEQFGELMALLENRGLLENTVVVFSSDHTKTRDVKEQVPLIFFFPDGRYRGERTTAAQLLDAAPTVLEFMGVSVPTWMEGKSLLGEGLPPERPIFSVTGLHRERFQVEGQQRLLSRLTTVGPPTYGLSAMSMVVCHRWYTWEVETGVVERGEVETYEEPCAAAPLPRDEARKRMAEHLRERGFSFPRPVQ